MLSGNAERGWLSHLCGASHWLAEMFSPAFREEASDEMWEKKMGDEPVCPQPQKDSFKLSNILKAFITFLVCLSVLVRLHTVQCFPLDRHLGYRLSHQCQTIISTGCSQVGTPFNTIVAQTIFYFAAYLCVCVYRELCADLNVIQVKDIITLCKCNWM